MKVAGRLLACLVTISGLYCSVLCQSVSAGPQEDRSTCKVVEIRGTVYLKRNKESTPIKLNKKRDVGRLLYVGEKVRCGKRGFLRIEINGEKQSIESQKWYPIPEVLRETSPPAGVKSGGRQGSTGNSNESGGRRQQLNAGSSKASNSNTSRQIVADKPGGSRKAAAAKKPGNAMTNANRKP